jgi:ribosomal protein S18 acetylase RimI-like enzyme
MTRPCSEPIDVLPLPEGIEVRPITPELMRAVFDAENEAFRDHWGYVEPTETRYQGWLNWPMTKPDLWKVAFDGDEIVGMVRNFINHDENEEYQRKRGYTENISVRRPWRRQGVARALLTQSIQMFIEMGMEETCLGVDTENPNGALALYSDVGYEKIHTAYTYRKPLD